MARFRVFIKKEEKDGKAIFQVAKQGFQNREELLAFMETYVEGISKKIGDYDNDMQIFKVCFLSKKF